ncbi:MAG TPA: hypothetical protein VEK34_02215 [Methylocella sp.]|nr:hypothetical protein [Methylocella sp.]
MARKFLGILTVWLLVVATFYVAEPYLIALWFSAPARMVTPHADLTESEQTSIKIFETVAPCVVAVFVRKNPQEVLMRDQNGVQTGSGIICDPAGHIVTNYHVIKGGRLIGITTMIISGSGASAGLGIAIPVDVGNRVVTQLINTGHVPLPGIGIAAATETAAAQAGIDGVIIIKVLPRSPAAQAGLKGMTSNGTIEDASPPSMAKRSMASVILAVCSKSSASARAPH